MAQIDLDQYYEDYEDYRPREKHPPKAQKNKKLKDREDNPRKKGKRSRRGEDREEDFDDELPFEWPDITFSDTEEKEEEPTPPPEPPAPPEIEEAKEEEAVPPPEPTEERVLPTFTHVVKGNAINFARVVAIEPIDRQWHERMVYGIKFSFRSNIPEKSYSKIAWFNTNLSERDRVLNVEFSYWESLQERVV